MSTSTDLPKRGPRALPPAKAQREDWTAEEVKLIKDTVARDLSDEEFRAFVYVARERHLNPLLRQIYAIKRRNKDGSSRVTHQTSIDGFRATAARTKQHAGTDDAVFHGTPAQRGFSASVTVWRLVAGVRCPFTGTARWEEYCPTTEKDSFMWRQMPHSQLGKCAEGLALRKGFPEELSNIYTADEMAQADNVIETTARDVTVPVPTARTLPAARPESEMERDLRAPQVLHKGGAEPVRPARKRKGEPAAAPTPTDHEEGCGCDRCWPPGDVKAFPDRGDAVAGSPVAASSSVVDVKISHQQRVLLWTCCKEQKVSEEQLRTWVREIAGVESTSDIPRGKFEALLARIEDRPEPAI